MNTQNCISLVYSQINQAWFVLWYDQLLHIYTDKREAVLYIEDITKG